MKNATYIDKDKASDVHNMESSLQTKLSGDSAQGKSVDAKIVVQSPARLRALQTLAASVQSKKNSALATSTSPDAFLASFEGQIVDKQHQVGRTGGERDSFQLDTQHLPLQKARGGQCRP
jgi:hypothetical protein